MAKTGRKQGDYEVGDKKPPKHTQYKKGQSGNPDGRPTGSRNTKTLLRQLLATVLDKENPLTSEKGKLSAEDLMHLKQIAKAINDGDTRAYEAVLDRMDGRPTQAFGNDPDNPLPSGNIQLVIQTENVQPITSEAQLDALLKKHEEDGED